MRSTVAIVACFFSVLIAVIALWMGKATPYGAMALVQCVWLITGLWLGQGLKSLKQSHAERVQSHIDGVREPVVAKTMVTGAIVLAVISTIWAITK